MKRGWTESAFWNVNNKKWLTWCMFNLPYLITLMAYLCSEWTPKVQSKYFVFHWSIYRLFVLDTVWKRDSLEMMNIRNCFQDIKHVPTKNAFRDVNNKKWRIWYKFDSPFLFNNPYGLPVLTKNTQYSNQVFYVCLVDVQKICAKYEIKSESLDTVIFEYVCWTWSIVELNSRFETWITADDFTVEVCLTFLI
jgi:hypothetical protein